MPYTKINFTETIPASKNNLDHVETQYDKAIADVGGNTVFCPYREIGEI